MEQEQIDEMRFPSLLVMLYKFQELGLSFDWSYQDEMIHSVPIPPDYLNDNIQKHYDAIRNLQPGFCDECGAWWMKRIQAYWGARPLFCPPCWRVRLKKYETTGDWPKADIPE